MFTAAERRQHEEDCKEFDRIIRREAENLMRILLREGYKITSSTRGEEHDIFDVTIELTGTEDTGSGSGSSFYDALRAAQFDEWQKLKAA